MALAIVAGAFAFAAGPANAHIERPSYWPDPDADTAVTPAAGGKAPVVRSLYTALQKAPPGSTRVVCQGDPRDPRKSASIKQLRRSVHAARVNGYRFRPTEDKRTLKRGSAKRLLRFNEKLLKKCRFSSIQAAVTASRNNDRVVVMPGVYTEPASRAKPTRDPACDKYEVKSDYPQVPGASSYEYDYYCPNDANLIAVMGREPGPGDDPDPPRVDRLGIPNLGKCIRCNVQLEGSGVTAEDVIIEAGDAGAGNGGPSAAGAKKDVGVRADRADGFVLTNMTVRHAREHGIYVHEVDGYALDRFKAFYNGLYGTLTFTSDHGLNQDCETVGHGDSGLYPGAPPETGEQRKPGTEFRYNQEIRRCDTHHNLAGYSATNGNAVHIHHNNFYDNALGIQTDIATSAGHPGFPDDSQLVEHNNFYANNFNPYDPGSDVRPAFPFPVGTGMWIAGGNNHTIRNNRFWNNWRRGVMIFAVPDVLICGPDTGNVQAGCDPGKLSTSHRNRVHDNVMGIDPEGKPAPNGTDFWWDAFPGNQHNCWYRNSGAKPITSSPASLPNCNNGEDPSLSIGLADIANEGELVTCLLAFEGVEGSAGQACPWFKTPPKPGSAAARAEDARARAAAYRATFIEFCEDLVPAATCEPFAPLLPPRR